MQHWLYFILELRDVLTATVARRRTLKDKIIINSDLRVTNMLGV